MRQSCSPFHGKAYPVPSNRRAADPPLAMAGGLRYGCQSALLACESAATPVKPSWDGVIMATRRSRDVPSSALSRRVPPSALQERVLQDHARTVIGHCVKVSRGPMAKAKGTPDVAPLPISDQSAEGE
jgi:hypothetical protein